MIHSNIQTILCFPEEIWPHIFDNLSYRIISLNFSTVSKHHNNIMKNYLNEDYWEKLCFKEKHASWDGKKLEALVKGPYFSWKKAWMASELPCYVRTKREFKTQESDYNTFYEIKMLFHSSNLEKTIIRTIGKNRFEKIPLFEECLQKQKLSVHDKNIHDLSRIYRDFPFPRVVRGKTNDGSKFIFMHPEIQDIVADNKALVKNLNEHFIYIISRKNSFISFTSTRYFGDSYYCTTKNNYKGISASVLKTIRDLALTGTCDYKYYRDGCVIDAKLRLDF